MQFDTVSNERMNNEITIKLSRQVVDYFLKSMLLVHNKTLCGQQLPSVSERHSFDTIDWNSFEKVL